MSYFPRSYAAFRHPAGTVPKIVWVDNWADGGEGSLRWAKNLDFPKIVAFAVGGYINLSAESEFICRTPYTTYAGQTAPGGGVTLRHANLSVKGSDQDFLHLRMAIGDDHHRKSYKNADCFDITTGAATVERVFVGNCSLRWAIDEIADITGHRRGTPVKDMHFYRCFFTEALSHSLHDKGEHSKGLLIGQVQDMWIKECLFFANRDRNPVYVGLYGGSLAIVNSLFHGIGRPPEISDTDKEVPLSWLALCGNHFNDAQSWVHFGKRPLKHFRVWADDNRLGNGDVGGQQALTDKLRAGDDPDTVLDGWPRHEISFEHWRPPDITARGDPWWLDHRSRPPVYPSSSVKHRIFRYGGCRPAARDAVDRNILQAVKDGAYTGDPDRFVPYNTFGSDPRGAYLDSVGESAAGWPAMGQQMFDASIVNDVPTDPDKIKEWLAGFTAAAGG